MAAAKIDDFEFQQKVGKESKLPPALETIVSKHTSTQGLDTKERYNADKIAQRDLVDIAPQLPPEAFTAVLRVINGMDYQAAKYHALSGLARYIPTDFQQDALSLTMALEKPYDQVAAASRYLPFLDETSRESVVSELLLIIDRIDTQNSRARSQLAFAKGLIDAGDDDQAKRSLQQVIDIAQNSELDDSTLRGALENMGDIERRSYDLQHAIEYYRESLEGSDQHGHSFPYMSERIDRLMKLAETLNENRDYDQAIPLYSEVADYAIETMQPKKAMRATRALLNIPNKELLNNPTLEKTESQIAQSTDSSTLIEKYEQTLDRLNREHPEIKQVLDQEQRQTEIDYDISTRLVPDVKTDKDDLGFKPLVDAIGRVLKDKRTDLPLAFAITAPWGGGKSSFMLQLKNQLCRTKTDATGKSGEGDHSNRSSARRFYTVQFDAWKYECGEQVWAALTKAMYEQPQQQMPNRWQRLWFRFKLELKRKQLFIELTIASAWIIGGFIAAALMGDTTAITKTDASTIKAGVDTNTLVATGSFLGVMLTLITRYGKDIFNPFKSAVNRHAKKLKQLDDKLGFSAEADQDIKCLVEILTENQQDAVAIFVDDLDRCSPKHVIAVIEAISQIFNADHNRNCVFILGMDREVVTASIHHQYRNIIQSLERQNAALANAFSENFLAKIVQASIALPTTDERGLRRMLERIAKKAPSKQTSTRGPIEQERVKALVEKIKEKAPQNPQDAMKISREILSSYTAVTDLSNLNEDETQEAVREVRAELLNIDSEHVATVEHDVLKHLPPNPRTLKRFDNAFRLQLLVASNTPNAQLDFTYSQLHAMGRWIALRFARPKLAKLIDKDFVHLELLESWFIDGTPELDRALMEWKNDNTLSALLSSNELEERISRLPQTLLLKVV